MRFGNWEIPTGLLVMPMFLVVAAVVVLWGWYFYSRQTLEMSRLATSHDWKFLAKESPESRLPLDGLAVGWTWIPRNIIVVGDPRGKVYLFHYEVSEDSNGDTSFGAACLAERQGGQAGELVIIYHRSPWDKLLEKAKGDIVEVGGEEFLRKFLVRCRRPDIAATTVTHSVEEVLLRPTSSLDWDRVFIAGGRVLVTVTLRLQPEEWDELLGIAKRLRAVLP